MKRYKDVWSHNPTTQRFLFATGIECSIPTIPTAHGTVRQDAMQKSGHYERWREDFCLARELGVRYLRYGLPLHRTFVGPGRYDWSWPDTALPEIRKHQLVPIVDLCHFGVPDWIGNFQNPDFPHLFAGYARAVAKRYPWLWCFTPVNEMFIAAKFSASYGWWNECCKSERAFVAALGNLVRANVEAMLAIIEVRPDAIFVLAESSETTLANCPELEDEAEMFNERRFLSLDLSMARQVSGAMLEYLLDHGMTTDSYRWFMRHDLREHVIMGHDYYMTNEKLLVGPGERVYRGPMLGYFPLAQSYFRRYRLPVMLTETNALEGESVQWLERIWSHIRKLRREQMPLCGMTWYSLLDQVDWGSTLRRDDGEPWPVGLFDLDRNIRDVGRAYGELIHNWQDTPLLPGGPLTVVGEWGGPVGDDETEETNEDGSRNKVGGAPQDGRQETRRSGVAVARRAAGA